MQKLTNLYSALLLFFVTACTSNKTVKNSNVSREKIDKVAYKTNGILIGAT